jgi:hypothetical protein
MFLLWRHPAQANVQWKEELSKDRDSMRQVLEGVCVCCCRGVLNLVGIDCSIISGVRRDPIQKRKLAYTVSSLP